MKKSTSRKRAISLVVCLAMLWTLCVPTFATQTAPNSSPASNNTTLPKGVILQEGEVWVPATSPEHIMTMGMTIQEPAGYTYIGYIKGNLSYKISLTGIGVSGATYAITTALSMQWLGFLSFIYTTGDLIYGYAIQQQALNGPYYKYICAKDNPGVFDYYHYCEYEFYIDTISESGRRIYDIIGRKTTYEWERI